jgi:hypothetical protein
MKKTEGQKSCATVSLSKLISLCYDNSKHIFKFIFVPVLPEKNTFKHWVIYDFTVEIDNFVNFESFFQLKGTVSQYF